MSRFALANLCGLVFGVLTVLSMLPMSFPDKRAALLGAFFNRFAIGFVVTFIDMQGSGWLIIAGGNLSITGLIWGEIRSLIRRDLSLALLAKWPCATAQPVKRVVAD